MRYDWFKAYRVVVLDLSDEVDEEYFNKQGVPPPMTVRSIDPSAILAYNLRVTPQTILVGSDGQTKGVWTGVLSSNEIKQIVKLMTANYSPRR
jgi:hypothetical protein